MSTSTVGDFKKFTYGSHRTIVILLVITISFYSCLSNYNNNYLQFVVLHYYCFVNGLLHA